MIGLSSHLLLFITIQSNLHISFIILQMLILFLKNASLLLNSIVFLFPLILSLPTFTYLIIRFLSF